ncbi:hypothetical protein NHX12_033363 [Muraenolepis orangiensis]|uniref:Uncharacterized protein n=1 Tax=Muraenolepis orangiensis TaxID=630683 RepID=A0A9Q0E2H7_9TELE|nr:hypothetical protein NHX12_033363 [Muraenolepis orangiensis]
MFGVWLLAWSKLNHNPDLNVAICTISPLRPSEDSPRLTSPLRPSEDSPRLTSPLRPSEDSPRLTSPLRPSEAVRPGEPITCVSGV